VTDQQRSLMLGTEAASLSRVTGLPANGHHPGMKAHLIVSSSSFGLALVLAQPGCGSSMPTTPAADGGAPGTTAAAVGVGEPCTPTQERDPTFLGFQEKEVNLETQSPSCATGVCLVNHFRGRVSCPYGQGPDGTPLSGASACTTSDKHAAVTGGVNDPAKKAQVAAQCVDRTADKTVYCSCRCANADGKTDDGSSYCACGEGFACTPLVTSIGADIEHLAGSYCIKSNTAYDASTACGQGDCDPAAHACN